MMVVRRLSNRVRYLSCRCVSYSMALGLVKAMLSTPIGRNRALAGAVKLFSVLDEAGIEYDARETASRLYMLNKLFPWTYARFLKCPLHEFERWIRVHGWDRLKPLLEANKGILLLSSHFGPGHFGNYVLRAEGYTVHSMRASGGFARKYMLSECNSRLPKELYVKKDGSPGYLQTITTIRDLLREGEIVMCALDGQHGISNGILLPLMGRQRSFRIALPLNAALVNARIVPLFVILNADGHIDVRFEDPFPERLPDQKPLAYVEEVVRSYVGRLQNLMESEPSHIMVKSLGAP